MSIKGLAYVTKRKVGQPIRHYVYAWRGGPCIMSAVGGVRPRLTAEAVVAYHEAIKLYRNPRADTIGGLATAWRASPEWKAYALATQKQWGRSLSMIEAKWGPVPLEVFDDRRARAKVVAWRDVNSTASLRMADMHVQVLRALINYGRMCGLMTLNVAEGVPQLYKNGQRAAIIWEPTERYVMELGLSVPVADAFRLACLTGMRRTDLVAVPRSAVGSHAIVWATSKSAGERIVTVPMLEPLRLFIAELDTRKRAPGVDTLLVNSRGRPWTPDGLDSSFGDERNRIGFSKHLHDCKGTFVTELCEAELTDQQIAGIVGWTTSQVADIRRIYVDQARTVVAIAEAIQRRVANQNTNQ